MFFQLIHFSIRSKQEQRTKDDLTVSPDSQSAKHGADNVPKSAKSLLSGDVATVDEPQPSTSGITLQPKKAVPITIDSPDDEVEILKEIPSALKRTAGEGYFVVYFKAALFHYQHMCAK